METQKIQNLARCALVLLLLSGLAIYIRDNGGVDYLGDVWNYQFRNYKTAIRDIERDYGICIKYDTGPDFVLEVWRKPPINGQITPISNFELSRYAKILPSVLNKYPKDIIRCNLDTLYLSGSLKFYGIPYGGTNLGNDIFLTSSGREHGFDDIYIEQLFHHEVSSILVRNYNFLIAQWLAANPPGFQYLSDFKKILQSTLIHRQTTGSEELYRQGVLTQYAMSTLENDVNIYAETIFTDPRRMKKLVAVYPAIRAKYLLVKDLYLKIHPDFAPIFQKIL